MALQLHDLTAWIAIDTHGVEVYGVSQPQPNHATCWIASEAGKKFSVNWRSATRAFPLQGTVTIDGLECNHHMMLDAQSFPDRHSSVGISYARTSNYTQRDFMFSAIQVTDDNAYRDTIPNNPSIGVITLEIYRLQVLNVTTHSTLCMQNQSLELQTVHSHSQEAGSHQVCYGDEYYSPAPIVDIVSGRRIGDAPYAIFTFRYQPIDMLIKNGIAPRLPQRWELVYDTAAEIARLEARLAELRSKRNSAQSTGETTCSIAGRKHRRKDANATRFRKLKGNQPAAKVVIDLTLNDSD